MTASQRVKVKGYVRENGTRVQTHWREVTDQADDFFSSEKFQKISDSTALHVGSALAFAAIGVIGLKFSVGSWSSMNRIARNTLGSLDDIGSTGTMKMYNRRAYRHLEGSSYDETLRNVENRIGGLSQENAFLINRSNGRIETALRGSETNTTLMTPLLSKQARQNLTFTHNHPKSTPLSPSDMRAQSTFKIREMRAANPDGAVYSSVFDGSSSGARGLRQAARSQDKWLRKKLPSSVQDDLAQQRGGAFSQWFDNPVNRIAYRSKANRAQRSAARTYSGINFRRIAPE
jgi:hypothetical protein